MARGALLGAWKNRRIWHSLANEGAKGEVMELLRLTGEVISIGDLPESEVPKIAGAPHLILRLRDGRDVLLSGLTREECASCVAAFSMPARFTVSSA